MDRSVKRRRIESDSEGEEDSTPPPQPAASAGPTPGPAMNPGQWHKFCADHLNAQAADFQLECARHVSIFPLFETKKSFVFDSTIKISRCSGLQNLFPTQGVRTGKDPLDLAQFLGHQAATNPSTSGENKAVSTYVFFPKNIPWFWRFIRETRCLCLPECGLMGSV